MRSTFWTVFPLAFGAVCAGAQAAPTGRSLTGLPALNFSSDEGVGYGALLQFYDYGTRSVSPYKYSLQPTVFLTTRGRRDVVVFLDAPHLLPEGWRMTASAGREQQLATPYYGIGNASVLDTNASKGANPYFYRYGRTVLRSNVDLQRATAIPALRLLGGVSVRSSTIRTVPYDSGTTLLAQQLGRSPLPARQTVSARLGVVLDTRDREIAPSRGNWSELLVQRAGRVAGGDEIFTRVSGTVRQYIPLTTTVTLATRVVGQTVRGDIPPTDLFLVQSSYKDDEALGGGTSIRGLPRNRYVGKGVAYGNAELRWSAAQFSVLGSRSQLVLAAFADAGRVWANGFDVTTIADDLHTGTGVGVHLAIGPSFVVTGDFGRSAQAGSAIYLGVGYLF